MAVTVVTKPISGEDYKRMNEDQLFTPERLRVSPQELLDAKRDWLTAAAFASGEDGPLSLDQEAVAVKIVAPDDFVAKPLAATPDEVRREPAFSILGFAIAVEITRYGGKLVFDRNRKPDRPAREYVKLSFGKMVTYQRVLADAQAHEEIGLDPDRRGDLRPEAFTRSGGGKPVISARAWALSGARKAAEKARLLPEAVAAYIASLEALFAEHDRLHALPARS